MKTESMVRVQFLFKFIYLPLCIEENTIVRKLFKLLFLKTFQRVYPYNLRNNNISGRAQKLQIIKKLKASILPVSIIRICVYVHIHVLVLVIMQLILVNQNIEVW